MSERKKKSKRSKSTKEKKNPKKKSIILGKLKEIDPFNFEIKSKETFKIEEDYIEKKGCTSITFGTESIMQKCYICPICNPDKNNYICKYCYDTCHAYCRSNYDFNPDKLREENNYLNEKEFACYCGIRLKHKPDEIIIKQLVPCNLIELDNILGVDNFYCQTHQINLCCICSFTCHKNCNVVKNPKGNNNDNICYCKIDNHTFYNELALNFSLIEYQKLSEIPVWKIQVINILFGKKNIVENFYHLVSSVFNLYEKEKKKSSKHDSKNHQEINDQMKEDFFHLLKTFTNIFNRKFKTFYYDREVLKMFRFEHLNNFINSIDIKDSKSLLLKFRLMFILLFIHLKRDFQMMKSLITVDFLTNNILERIYYKKIIYQKRVYTNAIDTKYNLKNIFKPKNILKTIIFDHLCNLMEVGMNYISIEENQNEFEIGLKLISFLLKRMIFSNDELIKLINSIYKFFIKFYEYINNDKSKIYSLLNIFMGLAEIFYMITVSYNDNIIMEYLDSNRNKSNQSSINEINDFIHVKSDYGNLLFRMVLQSCDILKNHYDLIQKIEIDKNEEEKKRIILIEEEKNKLKQKIEERNSEIPIKLPENGGLFKEKIIKIFNETLKMFSLAGNIYYTQLDGITKETINEYYYFTQKIKNNSFKLLKGKEIEKIHDLLYNLKIDLEVKLNELFCSNYSGEIMNSGNFIFKTLTDFANTIKENFAKKEEKKNENQLLLKYEKFERYGQEYDLDEEKLFNRNGKRIGDYLIKLAMKNSKLFEVFENNSFHKYIEDFVDCLIISNIDEVLGKVLVFLSDRKYPTLLNYELLDFILVFFSLFFFSKRGIKYFLMGKNLSRINKIFNRFCCKPDNKNINETYGKDLEENLKKINLLLKFITSMLKGCNLYEITLKNHKVLLRFKKNIIEHIEEFNKICTNTDYAGEFKYQFYFILIIFRKLYRDYEFEQFEEIKHRILLIFYDSPLNLLERNTFSSFFSFDEEDIKEEDKNLAKNIMKKVEQDNISEIDTSKKPKKIILKENSVADKTEEKKTNIYTIQKDDIILEDGGNERNITLDLYFAFFNLIGTQTLYHFNKEDDINIFNKLYNFNDFELYKKLFDLNKITIKQKTKILRFCRSIYLLDKLDYYDFLKQNRQLTTKNYIQLLESNTINEANISDAIDLENTGISKELLKEYKEKLKVAKQIELILKLYIGEIKKFPLQFKNIGMDSCLKLYKELLLGVKFIANFFYQEKEIWARLFLPFYELCIEFVPKVDVFKRIYKEFKKKKELKVFDMNFNEFKDIDSGKLYVNLEINDIKKKITKEDIKRLKEEKIQKLNKLAKNIEAIHSTSFDIYHQEGIYKYIIECYEDICEYTQLNKSYNLQRFLQIFDKTSEANFTPFSLIEILDYEYFYVEKSEENIKEKNKDITVYKIYNLKKSFLNTFVNIHNTNFYNVITRVSNELGVSDYRQKIIDYFISFLNSIEANNTERLEDLICIITKLLFYDVNEMQKRFEPLINDKYFFTNFNKLLNYNIILTFSLYKNNYSFERSLKIGNLTKLLIQFLQYLGAGFNYTFHDNIFKLQEDVINKEKKIIDKEEFKNEENELIEDSKSKKTSDSKKKKKKKKSKAFDSYKNISNAIPDFKVNKTIYESIIYNLKRSFFFLGMDNLVDGEVAYDKLIILTKNFVQFLIEYVVSIDENIEIIDNNMKNLFFGSKIDGEKNAFEILDYKPLINVIFLKLKPNQNDDKMYSLRKKILCYVKIKYVELLISYLQTGGKDEFVKILIRKKCSTIDLYQEILYNFKEILDNLQKKNEKIYKSLIKINKDEKYVNKLLDYYAFHSEFRNLIELKLSLKLYILIKIYENKYKEYSIRDHFDRLIVDESIINDSIRIRSRFSKRVHMFLETVVLNVEIRLPDDNETGINEINNNSDKISDNVIKKINIKKDDDINKNEFEEEKNVCIQSNNVTFFIRPYLTFSLSNYSKNNFEENVDRKNATSKFVSLLSFADYSLFEMVVNIHNRGTSIIKSFLLSINFKIIEIINYIIIIVQNVLLMYYYYLSPNLSSVKYDTKDESKTYHIYSINFILSIAQIAYLLIFLIIWFIFRHSNCYQLNLMQLYNHNFIFRKKNKMKKISQNIVDYFRQDEKISFSQFRSEINKNITISQMLYTTLFESILFNRDINIFLYSFLLTIIYIITKSSLFLIIQILFIINIISILFNIFKAIKNRFLNIIIVIILEFIIIYIFMWFSFYYLPDLFQFDNILDKDSNDIISEEYCNSSIQCFLLMIQQGILSFGGISDLIGKVSYKKNVGFFIMRFFYDLIFFLIIVLILGNIIFGIIINSLSELRIENRNKENDKKNICFICQISRDNSLTKKIDFDNHIHGVHNMWNYVYFLVHLHINNPYEFNQIESSVWEKLIQKDFSWLPIEKNEN